MIEHPLGNTKIKISFLGLGAWSFGSDEIWWGKQRVADSMEVLGSLLDNGINFIDTAPVYGRGKSETIIGDFLQDSGLRDRFVIATKCGLSWSGKKVFHDLKKETIHKEFDESRKRLNIDVIDIYQLHYPDPDMTIGKIADTMLDLWGKGKIKAVGVSNFPLSDIQEFGKYCPVHLVQMRYNMFNREIENEILSYCREEGVGMIAYAPLQHGLLSGKYHFTETRPKGLLRRIDPDMNGERFGITKETLKKLDSIASGLGLTLAQLSLNWVATRPGITSTLIGSRNVEQLKTNVEVMNFSIDENNLKEIDAVLDARIKKIASLEQDSKK